MKRKPNKPRPEPWAQTGRTDPGGGAADPGGSAFGAGSEKQSGPGEAGTSGQSVPKSPKSKFRQKSQQEQAAASKAPHGKARQKGRKGKEKLARQKPPKKPGPVKRAAGWPAALFIVLYMENFRGGAEMWAPRGPTAPSLWASPSCGMAPGL